MSAQSRNGAIHKRNTNLELLPQN